MSFASGARLGPYEIVAPIGAGGMGEVYKARDTRLGRDVAIKVLPAEFAADPDRLRRFELEARAVAALSHPNLLAIFDVGTHEAVPYLVTELLEGESLRERLSGGAMPVRKAVEAGVQIAQGLAAAHEKGIVHRDLKPGNVFVTKDGHIKILDFGIAKLVAPRCPDELDRATTVVEATEAGTVLGTVGYMSPEQVRGHTVDHRTDIFSFGCVLYEMLSGRSPFRRDTAADAASAILHDEPPKLSGATMDIPPALEGIVTRCLEKRPEERFHSASDLAFALRAVGVSPEPAHTSLHGTRDERPSIAVLPFANLSADKENEYFSDGLAEDIIDALTQVPGLRVMARTSAFAFRGKEADVREIGARLNVEHILEGSVRRLGSRIRVTAQLVKASDGYHLWSQRFDREMTDVFAIQDEISQAIVEKLRVRLAADRPLIKHHTENLEAYNLFLRGRHCILRVTPESLAKGKEYLEQAIALDSNYAQAYTAMVDYYFTSAHWGFMVPKAALSKAKAAGMEALSRDETLAEAHALLGVAKGIGDFDWAEAERELQRALELNPAAPVVRFAYGMFVLRPMGRLDEALSQLQRAVELDPLSPRYSAGLVGLYSDRGQHDLALAQNRRAMDLNPSFWYTHFVLAVAYGRMERFEKAIGAARRACELSGRSAVTLGLLALAYGRAGRHADARALLDELTTQSRTTYVPSFAMVVAHAGLREVDHALEWLEKGIEERDLLIVGGVKSEPEYIPLRGHPRYQALMRKMNLEP